MGALKVASMPQREMVDKPSSALDEIQLRTQRLQNKLDQVYCVWLSQGLLCLSWVTQKVHAVFDMSLKCHWNLLPFKGDHSPISFTIKAVLTEHSPIPLTPEHF